MAYSSTSIRYASVATSVVRYGYTFTEYASWTVSDLLELCGSETEIDHILCEDDTKRAERVTRLAVEIDRILAVYAARRLRQPLLPSLTASGSYVPGFVLGPDGPTSGPKVIDPVDLGLFRVTPVVEKSISDLSPVSFESLCGAMLRVVGCDNVYVTQSSKDDGVDAVAELRMTVALEQNSPLHRIAGSLSFLVYAQGKRYALTNPVRQEEVFELEGSWRAMRNAYFNGDLSAAQAVILERANYRSADPVMLLLMTSGRFTSGALQKATSLGIILLDGEQMAQLAIEAGWLGNDSRSVGNVSMAIASHLNS